MSEIEQQLLDALLKLERLVAEMPTTNPKPDLRPIFARVEGLAEKLPPGTDPNCSIFSTAKATKKPVPSSSNDSLHRSADTIAAIATPLGEGGIAMVRLSGPQSVRHRRGRFRPVGKSSLPPSGGAHATPFILAGSSARGAVVDEVLLSVMRAPRTFTREDVVEITCHGGLLPAKLVLDTVLENGARLAEPGEFTRRAFLNGRIDLAQAEAVADLIHARTELAAGRRAANNWPGNLSQRINLLRDDLMKILAHVEAHIDFPDEDIAPDTREKLLERLRAAISLMDELLRTANEGRLLRRGIRAAHRRPAQRRQIQPAQSTPRP